MGGRLAGLVEGGLPDRQTDRRSFQPRRGHREAVMLLEKWADSVAEAG